MLGISVDHIHSHRVFAASLGTLPYPLLSDWFKEVTQKYRVYNEERAVAERCVFIIDKAGIVRFCKEFTPRDPGNVKELFDFLETL